MCKIFVLSLCVLTSVAAIAARAEPQSEHGLWTIVDSVPFAPSASPPTDYAAARLDVAAFLDRIGAGEPRIELPLPDGSFIVVSVRALSPLASEISAAFPDLESYVFESLDGELAGRLTLGPGGVFVNGKGRNALLRIEPVQTSGGVFYVSFFDCNRVHEARLAARTGPRWRRMAAALRAGRDGVTLQHVAAPHDGMNGNVAALP